MKRFLTEWLGSWSWQGILTATVIFAVTFAISLALVSVVLVKLPADYFSETSERKFLDNRSQWTRTVAILGKNLLGLLLVLVGIVLSLPGVPGQGILTILLGIMLLDFPGKRDLERKIVTRPKVRQAIDQLRERFGKQPMVLD
jgi:hypothetical protein